MTRTAAVLGFLFALVLSFFVVLPPLVAARLNGVVDRPHPAASERARRLHARLLVADLHADSLLWGRDLSARSASGHVDVPRLLQGNVALQAFTVVTKSPRGLNYERNDDRSDSIFWLALAQRWPPSTWSSLKERALFQARRLDRVARDAGGRLVLIRTAKDLREYLERRRADPGLTAGFLGIEGAHALDGDLRSLDELEKAGFRMIAPTHFFDNDIGGSAHGMARGGLTALGEELIRRMEAKHMIVDVAHASPRTIEDVLQISTRPIVVSHTGVRGTCDNNRNLSDDQVRSIASRGGLVAIGYWETATCGLDGRAVARAIACTARLAGVDHVGLGSDFDGDTLMPFDTTGLAEITDALLGEGFSEEEISKIMGGNEIRLLLNLLPEARGDEGAPT